MPNDFWSTDVINSPSVQQILADSSLQKSMEAAANSGFSSSEPTGLELAIRARGVDPSTGNWIGGDSSPYNNGSDPRQVMAQAIADYEQSNAEISAKIDASQPSLWYESLGSTLTSPDFPWKTLLVLGILIVVVAGVHEVKSV